MLEWNDDLETGIKFIDDQHKSIIININKVLKMDKETDKNTLKEIVSYLMSYTNNHFLEEERLMIENNYDEFINHRQEHNLFVEQVYKIYLRINNEEINKAIFEDLKDITFEWFNDHLNNADRRLALYLSKTR